MSNDDMEGVRYHTGKLVDQIRNYPQKLAEIDDVSYCSPHHNGVKHNKDIEDAYNMMLNKRQ